MDTKKIAWIHIRELWEYANKIQEYKEEYLKLKKEKLKEEKEEIETEKEREKGKEGEIIEMKIIEGTKIKVEGWVHSCSISPDGTFTIIGSDDKTACLAEIKREKI